MDDLLTRFWTDLIGRASGPMTFRVFLQPIMAMLYAIRDGVHDAHAARSRTSGRSARSRENAGRCCGKACTPCCG
jgi:hypothetical protein